MPDASTATRWDYRARYYNPALGRFLSEDPLGFLGGSINLYVYVSNNPDLFGDPFGLKCCKKLDDDPANLRLLPRDVPVNNKGDLNYELRTIADARPNGNYYVFEHQTQHVAGSTNVGPDDNVTPYPDNLNTINWFEDTLGGGGLNSVQRFTISPDKRYDPECQYPVIIRYGNREEYGSQHVWQPNSSDPVVINYYSTIPRAR